MHSPQSAMVVGASLRGITTAAPTSTASTPSWEQFLLSLVSEASPAKTLANTTVVANDGLLAQAYAHRPSHSCELCFKSKCCTICIGRNPNPAIQPPIAKHINQR